MTSQFSSYQLQQIQNIESTISFFSLLACLIEIGYYYHNSTWSHINYDYFTQDCWKCLNVICKFKSYFQGFNETNRISTIRTNNTKYLKYCNNNGYYDQIFNLIVLNLIISLMYAIGLSRNHIHGFCQLQGFTIQWIGLAEALCIVNINYSLYGWIARNKSYQNNIRRKADYIFITIMLTTLVLALILLGTIQYEPTETWCWIGLDNFRLRFYLYYLFILISGGVISFFLRQVILKLHLQSIISAREYDHGLEDSIIKLKNKLLLSVAIYICTWGFGLINQFAIFINHQNVVYGTAILQAFFLSARGLLNVLIYGNSLGDFIVVVRQRLHHYYNHDSKSKILSSTPSLSSNDEGVSISSLGSSIPLFEETKYCVSLKTFSIFTTTLNFGESSFMNIMLNIDSWIVKGHDIYIICFQECLDYIGLKQLILSHLGEHEFIVFNNSIGSTLTALGFHGYIGLFVFIREKDLSSSRVFPTIMTESSIASGKDLVVFGLQAQNKGSVGISLQVHDTSIAFVSCHLQSDTKGASKIYLRHESAKKLLQEMNLSPYNTGCDIQFHHDHIIVLGDFNYRMDTDLLGGSFGLLQRVADACFISKLELAPYISSITNTTPSPSTLSWMNLKYHLLRSKHNDPLFPSTQQLELIDNAIQKSYYIWKQILSADELRIMMDDGDAFFHFYEPLPCFPPSYKRKKGLNGDCGDYTNVKRIMSAFSNTGIEYYDKSDSVRSNLSSKLQTDSIPNDVESESGDSINSTLSDAITENSMNSSISKQHDSLSTVAIDLELDETNIRPPSYTDRIIVHSLDDCCNRLHVQGYDLCDVIRVSDHRPVSMTLQLDVNEKVNFIANQDTSITPKRIKPELRSGITLGVFELLITDISVSFDKSFTNLHVVELESRAIRESVYLSSLKVQEIGLQVSPDDPVDKEYIHSSEVNGSESRHLTPTPSVFNDDNESIISAQAISIFHNSIPQNEKDVSTSNSNINIEKTDELIHRIRKNLSQKLSSRLLRNSPTLEDKDISMISVVFPLPSKDPLLLHKRVYEFARYIHVDVSSLLRTATDIVEKHTSELDHSISFSSNNTPITNSFLQPIVDFPWIEAEASDCAETADMPSKVQHCSNIKLYGIISQELGAHALLKLTNARGEDLGETLVSLTSLITESHQVNSTSVLNLPISSSGQLKGVFCGKFHMKYLSNIPKDCIAVRRNSNKDTTIIEAYELGRQEAFV